MKDAPSGIGIHACVQRLEKGGTSRHAVQIVLFSAWAAYLLEWLESSTHIPDEPSRGANGITSEVSRMTRACLRLGWVGIAMSIALHWSFAVEQNDTTSNATSTRFHSVASHLDLGGDFYLYLNVEDLIRVGMEEMRKMVHAAAGGKQKDLDRMAKYLDAAAHYLEESGFYNIASLGISSRPMANGQNEVKAFLGIDRYLENGSLWKAFGGSPRLLEINQYVPAGSSLVRTLNVDPARLWSWTKDAMSRVGGEEIAEQLAQFLAESKDQLGIHVDDLIGSLGDSFLTAMLLDPTNPCTLSFASETFEIPTPSILMGMSVKNSALQDRIVALLEEMGLKLSTQVVDGVEVLGCSEPLPMPFPVQPVMTIHEGTMLIATAPELLRNALRARSGVSRFVDSAVYATAFADMPEKINGLAYVDRSVSKLIVDLQLRGMKKDVGDNPNLITFIEKLFEKFAEEEGSAVHLNLPDGVLSLARSSSSLREKVALFSAALPVGMFAAIAAPSFVKARTTSEKNACVNHLRMIQAMKVQWALENGLGDGDMSPPDGLVAGFGGDLPVCPQGGAYTLGPVGEKPTCSIPGHKLP